MIQILLIFTDLALLVLRLVMGAIFLSHGLRKVSSLKKTQKWFDEQGFKPGVFWGTLVSASEVVGGIFLIIGLLTQPSAIVLTAVMAVAIVWKVFQKESLIGGYEFDLALLAGLLVLAASGSPLFSFDATFGIFL